MNENLISRARAYGVRNQLEVAEPLGSGKDRIVLIAKDKLKAGESAVKVLKEKEAYLRERAVYERLGKAGVRIPLGFNVPQLLRCDDELGAIQMPIVRRPFVLVLAGAYLDVRPEFSGEIWANWEAQKREQFEERWPMVERILAEFESLGIYLLDVSPGNIGFVD